MIWPHGESASHGASRSRPFGCLSRTLPTSGRYYLSREYQMSGTGRHGQSAKDGGSPLARGRSHKPASRLIPGLGLGGAQSADPL
jgi:hypothetical protein